MGTFNFDKKKEHEALAEQALKNQDYAAAFYHTTQAAEFTLALAEQCSGKLTQAYLSNANDLMDIAVELKKKAQAAQKQAEKSQANAAAGDAKKSNAPKGAQVDEAEDGEKTDGSEEKGRLAELPSIKLADVAGMEEAKKDIQMSVVEPIRNPGKAKKYGLKPGGGLLLYGLPGTGKTFFAKAVAGELGLPFYVIKSSDIFGKYVGESEANISKIFADARSHEMSIIFIDETNGILTARDGDAHETSKRVVDIILQEVNGIDSDARNPFLLIGATNYPDKIDDAGLDRFQTIIEVDLPVASTRESIIKREFSNMEIPVDAAALTYLAERTEGYSCRELVKLAGLMKKSAAQHEVAGITKAFCEENFKDIHVNYPNIAQGIETFKSRLGLTTQSKKKVTTDVTPKKKDDLAEYPSIKFSDVFGLEKTKQDIRMGFVEPFRNPEQAKKYGLEPGGKSVLLYGLPGTGKTFFAKAVAGELGLPFYTIKSGDIFGKHLGEAEVYIRKLFADARSHEMSIIFIDEVNGILTARDGDAHETGKRVVDIILQETADIDSNARNSFLLIGATNYPDKIDDAVLNRFTLCIETPLPTCSIREAILKREFALMPLPAAPEAFKALATRSEEFSCRELVELAEMMKKRAAQYNVNSLTRQFCEEHFKDIHHNHPTLVRGIEDFKARLESENTAEKTTPAPAEGKKEPPKAPDKHRITFADVKGLAEAKEIVNDALIRPTKYPEVYATLGVIPGNGLLLYGPPGTGKTMFGRAIANELNTEFLPVTLSDLRGKTPLQTADLISSTFAKARACPEGCVLFLDDCEELLSRPGNSKAYGVSQFLNELDGMKYTGGSAKKGKVFVLIATNRPWMIDAAFLRSGRISASVYVGLPETETRKEIIEAALQGIVLAPDVDIERLAELTEGYSCAEIYHALNGGGICNLARTYASRRWVARIEANPQERERVEPVQWADFMQALREVTPTAVRDAERIRKNEEFRAAASSRPQLGNVDQPQKEEEPSELPKRGFAYNVDDGHEISLSTPEVEKLKDFVFLSATIQETPDYKHCAETTFFLYNDKYADCKAFNAYATTAENVHRQYGVDIPGLEETPERPAIVIYDGLNIANTALAAAYLKYNPDWTLVDADSLRVFLADLRNVLYRNEGCITVKELAKLDKKYQLFPADVEILNEIKILASVMSSFVIAHELGHIVYGDIFKSNEGSVYSRNMERSADQFAADVLNGIRDKDIRDFLFLGSALSFITDIALGHVDVNIAVEDEHTHPATLERFRNLLRNAPEAIQQFGITETAFLQCIP